MKSKEKIIPNISKKMLFAFVLLIPVLSFLTIYYFSFVFSEPSIEELTSEATAIAQAAGIDKVPERHYQTGAVLEGSIPVVVVTTSRGGRREEAFDNLAQAIQARGYTPLEIIDDANFMSGDWRKGKVRVTSYVQGVRDAIQSLEVGFTVKEYKK